MDRCPDCDSFDTEAMTRRRFVQAVGVGAAAAAVVPAIARAEDAAKPAPETLVKKLFDSLDAKQKEEVCFAWDHKDDRGVLDVSVTDNGQGLSHSAGMGIGLQNIRERLQALYRKSAKLVLEENTPRGVVARIRIEPDASGT